jgi:hypothetical protein
MKSVSELKHEVTSRSIKFSIIGQLASLGGSVVYSSDITSFFNGSAIAPAKADRIRAACKRLIDLIDADDVRVDLSTVENVRRAEKRLAEREANKGNALAAVPFAPNVSSEIHAVLAVDNVSPAKIAASRAKKAVDRAASKAASEVLSVV